MISDHILKTLLPLASLLTITSTWAQTVVYDNLATAPTDTYSQPNANDPIFGDALNLTHGGRLSAAGFSIYNPSSGGNTGSILAGDVTLRFYDNTVPYAGGSLAASDPLLASVIASLDFGTGLSAGTYTTVTLNFSFFNITLPQDIFLTQQFTETSGTSTLNGVVLFGNPTVGSSPANVYISSLTTPEGLQTLANNPNQFGYHIEVVPEPAGASLLLLGGAALRLKRRRSP